MDKIQLIIEETYPTDDDPIPVRLHADHLTQLSIEPGDSVLLTAKGGDTIEVECQRNDHISGEKGLARMSPSIRDELGATLGDQIIVSAASEQN